MEAVRAGATEDAPGLPIIPSMSSRSAKDARAARLWGLVVFALALAGSRGPLAPRHGRDGGRLPPRRGLPHHGLDGLRADRHSVLLLLVPVVPRPVAGPRTAAFTRARATCSWAGAHALPARHRAVEHRGLGRGPAPRLAGRWAASAIPRTRSSRRSTPRSPSTSAWRRTTSSSRCARADARAQRDHLGRRPGRAGARARGVRREIDEDRFRIEPDDEDVHMAIERRLTEIVGPVGREDPHRPLAQRPGGHRRGDGREGHSLEARGLLLALMSTLTALAERHLDWPCPATRTSSARSRSTSRTTCSPTSGSSAATSSASTSADAPRTTCRSARVRSPA